MAHAASSPAALAQNQPTPTCDEQLHCPSCLYNLAGVCTTDHPDGACPECGLAFSREMLLREPDQNGPNALLLLGVTPVLAVVASFLGVMMASAGEGVLLLVLYSLTAVVGIWIACKLTAGFYRLDPRRGRTLATVGYVGPAGSVLFLCIAQAVMSVVLVLASALVFLMVFWGA